MSLLFAKTGRCRYSLLLHLPKINQKKKKVKVNGEENISLFLPEMMIKEQYNFNPVYFLRPMSQAKLFCDGLGSGRSYIVKSLLRRKPKNLVKQSDYITQITNMLRSKVGHLTQSTSQTCQFN